MKLKISLFLVALVIILLACEKEEKNNQTHDTDANILTGTWEGVAENTSHTIPLNLQIDYNGNVTGSGIIMTDWNTDSEGEIDADGFIYFTSGSQYSGFQCSWTLTLNTEKTKLTGSLFIVSFGNFEVELTKTSSSFPMEISITNPDDNSTVAETVVISPYINSASKISKVEFYIDENLIYTDDSEPFSYSLDTYTLNDGIHIIEVISFNSDNETANNQIEVVVNSSPEFVARLSSDSICKLSASSLVNIEVTAAKTRKVEFYIDENLKYTDTIEPYIYSWNTSDYDNKEHTIKIIAYNKNNVSTEESISRMVINSKWEFLTGGAIKSSPAIGTDGTIYVGSCDKKLYAINSDGTKKWEFLTGGEVNSSPSIGSDGTIYIGSDDKKLYAINSDGTKKWEYVTYGPIKSSPAIGSDGTVYVGSGDYNLYAINPVGTKKWNIFTEGEVNSSPSIGSDGTIYFGSESSFYDASNFYAVNSDGTVKWKYAALMMTKTRVKSSPAIASDGTIYVNIHMYDDNFPMANSTYAFNANGEEKWEYFLDFGDRKIESSPIIGNDGTIYVHTTDDFYGFIAINPYGTEKYKSYDIKNGISTPTIGSNGTIFLSFDNLIYAVDSKDGEELWGFSTGGEIISSPVIGTGGTIYIGSNDNKLYAIQLSESLGNTSWPMFRHDIKHTGRVNGGN